MKDDEKWCDRYMTLIDTFISLQLIADNLPKGERLDYIVKHFRKFLAEDFEFHFGALYPIYLDKIKTKKSGPYSPTAFDAKHQPNLLNL